MRKPTTLRESSLIRFTHTDGTVLEGRVLALDADATVSLWVCGVGAMCDSSWFITRNQVVEVVA